MKLNFYSVSLASAFICFSLAIAWMFAPQMLFALGEIVYTYPAGLVGRRGAGVFLGIGVMFVLARNTGPSPARSALAYGFSLACGCLAVLGLYEYFTGHLGAAIFFAIVVELVLAVLLLIVAGKK